MLDTIVSAKAAQHDRRVIANKHMARVLKMYVDRPGEVVVLAHKADFLGAEIIKVLEKRTREQVGRERARRIVKLAMVGDVLCASMSTEHAVLMMTDYNPEIAEMIRASTDAQGCRLLVIAGQGSTFGPVTMQVTEDDDAQTVTTFPRYGDTLEGLDPSLVKVETLPPEGASPAPLN